MTYVIPAELKALLDQDEPPQPDDPAVAARLALILERHEAMVRDQVRREERAPAFGHEIRFFLHPAPGNREQRSHFFGAECSCRTWNSGLNALKWVLLGIQEHLAEHHLTWDTGNLVDGDEAQARLEGAQWRIQAAREVLIKDGYFRPHEVGDDIAPRIVEMCSHWRQRLDEALPGALLEALEQLRTHTRTALDALPLRTEEE